MTSVPEILPVTAPATGVAGPPQGRWTYAAYAAIPEDGKRYEIVDGVLYVTPAPSLGHQGAVTLIGSYLTVHVQLGGCGVVFVSPVDVELRPGGDLVQPDIVVVLNQHRAILTPSHIVGAPDLVVEVSSPSTAIYDRRGKLDAYARAGVPEYWLADPYAQVVELLYLENGRFASAGVFRGGATLPSRVLPDFSIEVERFFA